MSLPAQAPAPPLQPLDEPHDHFGPRCERCGALRDYCEELRDSLDLVPIGAWHGNGRKVGWFSPFLLAAYDPDTEDFQSVRRCMSGYTDAFYAEVGIRLAPTERTAAEPNAAGRL